MKIAIISDSHDNLPSLRKAVGWINKKKIRVIIHCGDVSDENFLKEALGDFKGRIYLSRGNCDLGYFKKISKLKIFEEFGEVKFLSRKIAFAHFPRIAEELAQSGKYDLVFYGHTHKPWIKQVGETRVVNPGNLAGVFYKATFAVYDTKSNHLDLKILEKIPDDERNRRNLK